MIQYTHFTLQNGLRVYVHQDKSQPMAVMNILYDVGSRDESEDKTGFAHLFEHLMFGGSVNIPSYDEPLQKVGGDNNAFTSPDITNYYLSLPAVNLETGFWLESDRMLSLAFSPESLEVQRKVVIEEFKQRYLNQPYGDVRHLYLNLAYQVHPYKWTTIGKDISHIEQAKLEDVKAFFHKHYTPSNAILVVAGNVEVEDVKNLCIKWFEPIPAGNVYKRNLPKEPRQTQKRTLEHYAKVPVEAIYKVYHCCAKSDNEYYETDLLSDILGRGKSSRLYQKLVKNEAVFNSLEAYISGSIDNGLLVIQGKLNEGYSPEKGEEKINEVLNDLLVNGVSEYELQKVKNQAESTVVFSEMELLRRAMHIAYFALLGDVDLLNQEQEKINAVSTEGMLKVAKEILREDNASVLYYKKSK